MAVVTINVEADRVSALVVKGRTITQWESRSLEPGLVVEGAILNPDAVAERIDALLKSLNVSRKKVVVSVSGLRSTPRFLALPKVKPKLLEEGIRRAAKREMPVPLEEMYLAWHALGKSGNEQHYFAMGVQRQLVDAQIRALESAAIKPGIVEPKPLSLVRAVNRGDALILDLESDCFSIILVAGGLPIIMRTIGLQQGDVTIEDSIGRLLEEVLRTVAYYDEDHPDCPLDANTPAILTGRLSEDPAVVELISAGIAFPLSIFEPPLHCPPDLQLPSYAVNIGLALKAVRPPASRTGPRNIDLNTIPEKYKPRLWSLGHLFLILALLVAIEGLVPLHQAKTRADMESARLNTELAAVTRQLRETRVTLEKERTLAESINKVVAETRALSGKHTNVLASGSDFTAILRVALDRMPPETGVKSISVSEGEMVFDFKVTSPSYVLTRADIIEYAKMLGQSATSWDVNIRNLTDVGFSIAFSRLSAP